MLDGEVGHRRRRDDAEQLHVCADRADARHQRIFQHIRGDARVLADQQLGLARVGGFLRERIGCRRADLEGEQGIQLEICYAADAVRPKVSTHIIKHLTF